MAYLAYLKINVQCKDGGTILFSEIDIFKWMKALNGGVNAAAI